MTLVGLVLSSQGLWGGHGVMRQVAQWSTEYQDYFEPADPNLGFPKEQFYIATDRNLIF